MYLVFISLFQKLSLSLAGLEKQTINFKNECNEQQEAIQKLTKQISQVNKAFRLWVVLPLPLLLSNDIRSVLFSALFWCVLWSETNCSLSCSRFLLSGSNYVFDANFLLFRGTRKLPSWMKILMQRNRRTRIQNANWPKSLKITKLLWRYFLLN